MATQLQLPAIKAPSPKVNPDDVKRLVATLERANAWMTAKEIAAALYGTDCGPNTERKIRAIASVAAPVVVSYPGSPGYRLFDACTIEEINHCINAFHSQGRDMFARAVLYTRAYHKRTGPHTHAEQLSLAP